MVPKAILIVSSVILLVAVIVAQAADEDFETWNLEEYEPYDKRTDQLALADLIVPYEKRGKTKFIHKCLTEGKVCTCDMRFSTSSGRRYTDCRSLHGAK
ncbi:uncharacterized protein [Amphiura filiformis]|uniref:uncharacterized protein isoform X2 n=1 Tax=Amphiura filiformis TaxID=82378 RepID=UPI003B20E09F